MENQNRASGDAISQLLVDTAVLHAVVRQLIRDPSLSREVLERAREEVERTCNHTGQDERKAAHADLIKRMYTAEIDVAITHRP